MVAGYVQQNVAASALLLRHQRVTFCCTCALELAAPLHAAAPSIEWCIGGACNIIREGLFLIRCVSFKIKKASGLTHRWDKEVN